MGGVELAPCFLEGTNSDMDVWFVLFCKQRKDAAVERNLVSKGHEIYRPLLRSQKRNKHGRSVESIESLFPRYLFLKVSLSNCVLEPITHTPGVVGFVKFGDSYSVVDESVIEDIKLCEVRHLMAEKNKKPDFAKGETVYLNGDGFCDIKATFVETCSNSRVTVLLKILGTITKTVIPAGYISKKQKLQ